jgi:hypothetical protein
MTIVSYRLMMYKDPLPGMPADRALLLGKSIIEEGPEHPRSAWVLELSDCLGLDLPNALARHRKLLADFLQRVVAVHAETKAHAHDALLAWR